MKILYIAHSGSMQGSGFALLNIIKGMQAKGVEILVMLPHKGNLSDYLDHIKVAYYVSPLYNAVYPPLKTLRDAVRFIPLLLRLIVCNHRSAKQLKKIVTQHKVDIVHSNTGVIHFGLKVAQKCNVPHVWHIREFQDKDFGWTPIGGIKHFKSTLATAGNTNIVITQSVFKHYGLTKKNSNVIYDGVFSEKKEQVANYYKQKYFLFVGAIIPGKAPDVAVEAFMKLAAQYPVYELWLAGDDGSAFASNLKAQVASSPFAQRIKFLGFRTDIDTLMATASALLVCSLFEGFGFITTEAMLNHCLVIGHDTAGTKEQFDNGVALTGQEIALRYTNQTELIEQMRSVVSNGIESYLPTIQRANQVVNKLYTTEKNVDSIYKLYKEIIQYNG